MVARPATSMFSLMLTGTPCSGPPAGRRSASSAAASASSACTTRSAPTAGLTASMRSTCAATTSRLDSSRARMAAAWRAAPSSQISIARTLRRGRVPGRNASGAAARFGRGGSALRRYALPAGRAVRRSARMAGASLSARAPASRRAVDRRRRPANQQPQSPIVGALLGARADRAGVHRAKHGPARAINDRDDDLRAARRVEHDPVHLGPAIRHLHELTCAYRLHRRKRTRRRNPATDAPRSG